MSLEPTGLPSGPANMLPLAWKGKKTCPTTNKANGLRTQTISTETNNNKMLLERYCRMFMPPWVAATSANQMQIHHDHVDQFNADEGQNHAPQSPNQQVPAQQGIGAQCPVADSFERHRDEHRN